jgi:hypothetical protein
MRIWLQKQKKKEEKAVAQATPAPVETTPAPAEVQPAGDAADKPMDSIEDAPKVEGAGEEEAAVDKAKDASQVAGSAAPQTNEVGLCLSASLSHLSTHQLQCSGPVMGPAFGPLAKMNMIVAARASDQEAHSTSPCTVTDPCQDSVAPQDTDAERRGSNASQHVTKSAEPPTADAPTDEQNSANGPNGGMMGNNPMMMNGMAGMPYGFPNQPGFNSGMYGGMPNMMGNGGWNGMNSMGTSLHTT